jgi:hypothetical protein
MSNQPMPDYEPSELEDDEDIPWDPDLPYPVENEQTEEEA